MCVQGAAVVKKRHQIVPDGATRTIPHFLPVAHCTRGKFEVTIQQLTVRPVHLPHPALGNFVDDTIVTEGATDEVIHLGGSNGVMASQLWEV